MRTCTMSVEISDHRFERPVGGDPVPGGVRGERAADQAAQRWVSAGTSMASRWPSNGRGRTEGGSASIAHAAPARCRTSDRAAAAQVSRTSDHSQSSRCADSCDKSASALALALSGFGATVEQPHVGQ